MSNERPKVFLHIGEPKSGTSFVQGVMWGNRDALLQQGVLLPGAGVDDHWRAMQDLRDVGRRPGGSTVWDGQWDLIAAEARKADRVAVISTEMLVGATADQAARAVRSLAPADVHVVLSVRDFASLLPAEWQETVKHRNTMAWDEWLERIVTPPNPTPSRIRWFWLAHDPVASLRRWTALLPPENVHLVTMPAPGAPRELLWERFASLLGVDPATADISTGVANPSLGLPEVEMLRRLNAALPGALPPWFYTPQIRNRISHRMLARRPKRGKLGLSPEMHEWAVQRADQIVTGLRAAGYDVVGDLEELRPRPRPDQVAHPSEVSEAQIADAAIATLAYVLREEFRAARRRRGAAPATVKGKARQALGSPGVRRRVHRLGARFPVFARARVRVLRRAQRGRAPRADG